MKSKKALKQYIRDVIENETKEYSGEYDSLYSFILDNNLQQKFAKIYKINVLDWEDYVRGELGYDEEIIKELVGNDYKVFYNEKKDVFIITKKKTESLKYKIRLSNGEYDKEIIDAIQDAGILSVLKPRFCVIYNNKVIGGSTFNVNEDNLYNFDLGILDEYKGYGILKNLMTFIISDAKQLKTKGIKVLVVNEVLFKYLKKIGFSTFADGGADYAFLRF
jgi:hypothetical protein